MYAVDAVRMETRGGRRAPPGWRGGTADVVDGDEGREGSLRSWSEWQWEDKARKGREG